VAGVVLAIRPDGDLLWYRYTGDGTADQTGATGWEPNSSNPIGRGSQNFQQVLGGLSNYFPRKSDPLPRHRSVRFDALAEADLDHRRGALLVRRGKADAAVKSGWTHGVGKSCGPGPSGEAQCPSVRFSASSTVPAQPPWWSAAARADLP